MNQTRHIAKDEIEVDFGCPEEAAITEIEIAPDGRLFLFGASAQVLAALRDCGLADERLDLRIPVFTSTSSTPGTPLGTLRDEIETRRREGNAKSGAGRERHPKSPAG